MANTPGPIVTQEKWDEVVAAFRKHGVKFVRVGNQTQKAHHVIKRWYYEGYPPKFPAIRDILAADPPPEIISESEGDTQSSEDTPAPVHVDATSPENDTARNAEGWPRASTVGTSPRVTKDAFASASAEPARAELMSTPVSMDADRILAKALDLQPKLVNAEMDQLTMLHSFQSRALAKLLKIWQALEPSIDQMAARLLEKPALKDVSEQKTMRRISELVLRMTDLAKLNVTTNEQTRLLFGQPTSITEVRTGAKASEAPDEMLARMAGLRARLEATTVEPAALDVHAFEEGGDTETEAPEEA